MANLSPSKNNTSRAELPPRPAPMGRTAFLAILVFGTVTGGILYLTGRDAVSYVGYIQADQITLKAPFSARMESILVEEGEAVVPNVPLFSLVDDKLERRQKSKQQLIVSLKTDLERAEAQARIDLAWRMKSVENELLETKLKSANLLREQFAHEIEDIAWSEYSEDNPIEVASLASTPKSSLQIMPRSRGEQKIQILLKRAAAQNANEVIQTQVELCQSRLSDLEQLKTDLPEAVQKANGVEALKHKLAAAEEESRILDEQVKKKVVQSSGYGLVGLFEVKPGQTIEEGQSVVKIFDHEQLFVVVDVPSDEVHRYQIDDRLNLEFPNGNKNRGKIAKIAPHVTSEQGETHETRRTMVRLWLKPADALWPASPIGSQIQITR